MGRITQQASTEDAQTLQTTINLSETEQTRQVWPYLRDRRTDAYKDITKQFIDDKV